MRGRRHRRCEDRCAPSGKPFSCRGRDNNDGGQNKLQLFLYVEKARHAEQTGTAHKDTPTSKTF